jgi:hypothetical protein
VISDQVSAIFDFFQQRAAFPRESSNYKKSSACMITIEDLQQPWSDLWIRAVVESKSELSRGICPPNRRAKQMRTWVYRAIRNCGRRGRERDGYADKPWIHEHIVARRNLPITSQPPKPAIPSGVTRLFLTRSLGRTSPLRSRGIPFQLITEPSCAWYPTQIVFLHFFAIRGW